MTEFTSEWIAKQKKLLDGYTTDGVFENPHVDYSFEIDILQEHYPEALDHIEHLQKRVEELEGENSRLSVLLHDEMNQLELTIDLSNKRWIALNNIYTDGEKHNANWCKRKAQEGLGIK